ncbi:MULTISPECIES: hypothetical protein [Glutamicibacter]|uniref:Uncharacterized protein n=1 Tax=Glutamicibacter halophytocola TaxID=1933880 RepID=A0A5B8IZ92_9MICC|nr:MULTISPECIES: hypothetical protein [Glutamicibacter]MBF6671952.1 hypothetical protein [Glutamicibacter sp. FBE19]NQD39700.1 hypothetical protein [Glutamicibacter halophytocola]QDY67250.1 hypothetical protein FQA45_13525 [Glutamicibacter halophytocola]UUX59422.1 hypothetical protein NUH22_01925 [Glutamicibacter halophytocola]
MKGLKVLAVAALALAPVTAVAAPASAALQLQISVNSGPVATPAGWGADFSKWVCERYGVGCP